MPRRNRNQFQDQGAREEREAQQAVLGLFGLEGEFRQPPYAPRTNSDLMTSRHLIPQESRNDYGLVARTIERRGNRIKVEIPPTEEPVKSRAELAGELRTKAELAEETAIFDERDRARVAEGQFAVEIAPVLIIGQKAYGFRRGGSREGQGISTFWPAQSLPSQELGRDLTKEFLLIGRHKKTGKRVLLVPQLEGSETENLVWEAKGRVNEGVLGELRHADATRANVTTLGALAQKSKMLSEAQDSVTISAEDLTSKIADAQTVEYEIDGKSETSKGLVRFDETTNTLTITKAVRLDPEDYDVEILDGTGRNRQVVVIDSPDSGQSFEMLQITTALDHEARALAQREKSGAVNLPNPTHVALLREKFPILAQRYP